VPDAVREPQIAARRMVVGIPDPAIGTLYVAGNPIKMDGLADGGPPPRSAPDVDADRETILDRLGASLGRRR
jgi:crotonobetainyl-CoA:carnitine CoA-transferase CaiB-like acyl-CoA transferase